MFEDVRQQIIDWISDFLRRDLLPEAIAFGIIILFGLILSWILRILLKRLTRALEQSTTFRLAPWLRLLLDWCLQVVRPLSIWLMGKIVINIMGNFDQPHGLLDYTMVFIGLWLIYRILSSLIHMLMEPDKVHLWKDQILRPTIIVLALMHVVGILDSILAFKQDHGKGVVITIGALLSALVTLYIFVLLGRYVRGLLRDVVLPRMDADPSIIPVVATFSSYVVVSTGLILGLMVAGVDLTAIAVILGDFSVGIGFGMQQLVNNFISGFILLFERSLVPGDFIESSSATGVVEDIRLRTTHIRTGDNHQLIVPNGQLLGGTLTNYSDPEGPRRKRIRIILGANYNDNPHEVMAALIETANDHPEVLDYPEPQVLLTGSPTAA